MATSSDDGRDGLQARDKQRRMFYTDEERETVPHSDDEWDEQFGLQGIFGRHRPRKEWVLRTLLQHYSFSTQVRCSLPVSLRGRCSPRPPAARLLDLQEI